MMAQEKLRQDSAIQDRNTIIAAMRAERSARGEERAVRGEDRAIWKQGVDEFTDKTAGGFDGPTEITRWEDLAKQFERSNRPDLAAEARSRISQEIDYDSDDFLKIEMKWQKKADERNPIGIDSWRKEATDKAYDGLGEEGWVRQNAEAEYRKLKGLSTPTTSPVANNAGGKPDGSGTKTNPYIAANQADIDWFKANAGPGDIIEIDGKTYSN